MAVPPPPPPDDLSPGLLAKGWRIVHTQPALSAGQSPTGVAVPGFYAALKRDAGVNVAVEQSATSLGQLKAMIQAWEDSHP